MTSHQSNGRFIIVLTNETNKTFIPVKENMLHGKRIKGDFLLPLPAKTRREFHYSNTSDDMYHKLIETQLTFLIQGEKTKNNVDVMFTAKHALGAREVLMYYQPLPLNCEKSKQNFNERFIVTSCLKREFRTNILYINIRNRLWAVNLN